jgi:hypothetical protein
MDDLTGPEIQEQVNTLAKWTAEATIKSVQDEGSHPYVLATGSIAGSLTVLQKFYGEDFAIGYLEELLSAMKKARLSS